MRDVLGLDIIVAMRSRFIRLAIATATVCTVAACQTPASEGATKAAPAEVKPLDVATPVPDAKAPAGTATTVTAPGSAGDPTITASAGETPTTGASAGSAGTADPSGAASTSGAAESAGPPDTAGAAATAGTPPAADPAATAAAKTKLLTEVKNKKTSDARAKKALEEAEAAGATLRELAEASNARGLALQLAGEGERATAAFEWARDKDTTYPDASFNLAKQTVNAGDVTETVAHLKEVHKRGGKTLLKQVGFDPTFQIVKDDPEIAKIVK